MQPRPAKAQKVHKEIAAATQPTWPGDQPGDWTDGNGILLPRARALLDAYFRRFDGDGDGGLSPQGAQKAFCASAPTRVHYHTTELTQRANSPLAAWLTAATRAVRRAVGLLACHGERAR